MGSNLNRNRDELAEKWEPTINAYFKRLKSRIDGIIGRHLNRETDITKQGGFPFSASNLVPDSEIGNLSEVLYRMFVEVSRETYGIINASGVAGEATWSEASPVVSSLLTQAPARASIIHRTTKKNVQKVLTQALERGYSIDQLARGVPNDDFVGIRSLLNETANRSKLIARTEIMRSQNLTSVNLFKNQGFEYVRAYDVDGDPNDTYIPSGDPYGRTCIERDGQVYRADDARDIVDHPNGTLSWVPMPRSYQPEGVTA